MTEPADPHEDERPSARPAFRWAGAAPHPALVVGKDATSTFYGQALHVVARLGDHIQRLDSGVTYAIDDVAVVMRAMLGNSNGNRVLLRMHDTIKAAPIEILLTRPPDQGKEVRFSFGSVPASTEAVLRHGGRWVPLHEWPKQPVIASRVNGATQTWTWATFIDRYSNQWGGAHLDKKIADTLQYIDKFAVGGFALSGYLLRTAAVQAWLIGQALLMDWTRTVPAMGDLARHMPPEVAEGRSGFYMSGEGGDAVAPLDRRHLGELHFFAHHKDHAEYLAFVEPGHAFEMTIGLGAISYTMTTTPTGAQPPAGPLPVNRPRTPAPPTTPLVVSSADAIRFTGQTLGFPSDEPLFC